MNPDQSQNPQNLGSFGAPAGGNTSALSQVMQQVQSGQYVPQTSQVTNSAPGAPQSGQPLPVAPQGPSMPPQQPPTSGAPDATQGAPASTMPFDSAEAKIIIGALSNRLKAGSEFNHGMIGIHPTQQPPKLGG